MRPELYVEYNCPPLDKGSCEKIREGEAPAEPPGGKLLIVNGSAGASPSQGW